MKLIDVDELRIIIRHIDHNRQYIFADITDARAVDAIQLDWLEGMAEISRYLVMQAAIDYLLTVWRECGNGE